MFGSQLARAGLISIPLTLGILLLVFGSLVGASIPLLLALTSVFATMGLVALPSQIVPMDESVCGGHPADRARGRRRLLALLHPPRA